MQDQEKLREIESLGQDQEALEEQEEYWEEPEEKQGGGGVPILQAVICALVLVALLFFKFTDTEKYQGFADWYAREMAQEIELPQFKNPVPEPVESPGPSPTPAPTATPSPVPVDGTPPQML